MTKDQQTALEQAARELVEAYYNEDDPDYPTAQGVKSNWLQARIVALLAAQRAAVLEEAAVLCEAMPMSTPHNLAVSLRYVAQEQRP